MREPICGRRVVISVIGAALLGCVNVDAEEPTGPTPLAYSDKATEIVLTLRTLGGGGMGKANPSYTLYGDGRLVFGPEVDTAESGLEKKAAELYLARSEVVDLLRVAVDRGLLEADRVSIERGLRDRLGGLPTVNDAGAVSVAVHLTSYGVDGKPVSKELGFSAPGWYVRELKRRSLPALPELDALVELRRRLREYADLAESRER